MSQAEPRKFLQNILTITPEDKRKIKRQTLHEVGIEGYKALLQAFGSDWAKCQTKERAVLLALLHHTPIPEINRLTALRSLAYLSRRQAYRLLATLPHPLRHHMPSDVTEPEVAHESNYWIGIAGWLLFWEKRSEPLKSILDQGWKSYEPRARIAELRYQMIRKLVDERQLSPDIFPSPELPWLLAEVACCRQRLYSLDMHTPKNRFYDSRIEEIHALNAFDSPLETQTSQGLDKLLFRFDTVVETAAREYAERDTTFDRQYFKPYLSACTAWNREQVRGKNFQPIRKQNQRERIPPKRM
ncbi:MAG: hypothetical protein J0L70_26620 [Leptolyngbya sp. UWPOB_LEPTO1]|uniref:hypothetical protein n=1 Tax=Leptolyngbya sp. UWPOB_LEPTO1 TaxID=2815653 RepID=UPI001AC5A691|nr:hypothetical protein [Leptolyngbya sp. UWPOB_LEPTO1]MBN8564115.1 hypothetical protein [Leptolyngbya sp. UWPOB_LEPTO1]